MSASDPVFNLSLHIYHLWPGFSTGSVHLSTGHSAMAGLWCCLMVGPTAGCSGAHEFRAGGYAFLRMGLQGVQVQSEEYRG